MISLSVLNSVWSPDSWHYLPPPEIEPVFVSEMLQFILKRMFYGN